MKSKIFKYLEIAGAFVTFLIWMILHSINYPESLRLINILFGPANNSIWESEKTFLIACVFWGLIELCWARPPFRSFVSSKTIAIYTAGISYGLICSSLEILGMGFSREAEILSIALLTVLFHISSYCLMKSCPGIDNFFIPSLFLLLLFSVIYVCFTPYPPKLALFYDFENNIYGIIPPDFDKGAVFLDSLHGI